ncbi:hypothetical protein JX580_11835 [Thiomicrospira microaerophila]|uniref:hypothetical protein n=1 Tax=Thiomicrospira microaerophila TaxID=406020 RepID=UPI00200DFC1F|nr:hypothetical protein [Thiomicrospira microaerophila]UQB42324.1 hypothetical protein JX580_11835 [Thiomicrospira microaerophila]
MTELIYKFGRGTDEAHKRDQALFAELLKQHHQLKRETHRLDNGILARTTSSNPQLAKILQQHVIGMEQRFASNRAIRSWDPLFAALFEFRHQINMEYRSIKDGVEALLTSDDPKLIELIHCHDQTLHQFVDFGYEKSGEVSPKPDWLDD